MSTPLSVEHALGERIAVAAGGTEILSYVYRPDPVEFESRKPYAHPVRTLGGALVTGYRPNDHRWHKGLQMTASHLSEQNFWGGNSYLGPDRGYQPVHDRIGSMRHEGFPVLEADAERVTIAEDLTWLSNAGEAWAAERRTLTVHSADAADGSWALDWAIHLTNTRGEPLRFGSPTTAGREMAGYTGLQWRGPRDFTGGTVLLPGGPLPDEEAMGTPAAEARWLGFTAERDDTDAHTTLLFVHAPENTTASAVHPSHWFVRSQPIPTVAFSWAFFEEFELAHGESFSYRYRVVFADGAWDAERAERYVENQRW
ncbi:PmoA family protein [Streptomyces sp. RFCAC02]|uniref:DUF6807 domain-containing protein n=1 Tax=Streptomyces sp. RFCAC02 TaxID=2499143 RepID=UPI00101FFFC0|nr:PmoA family protein [Streptomyces sp. RFCAC02]